MSKVNIVIVGAKSYANDRNEDNDIELWNNKKQADLCVLTAYKFILEENFNVTIKCIDCCYKYNTIFNGIQIIKDTFKSNDTQYLEDDSINIIIEFCNMFNENWCTLNINYYKEDILKYYDYKIALLSCGCSWGKGFVNDAIDNILKYNLVTPFNVLSIESFIVAIEYTSLINEHKINNIMKPYNKGLLQILGTVLYRGYNDHYESEIVLNELFQIIDPPLNNLELKEFNKFINKKIHWNNLNNSIRTKISLYIYNI